MNFDDQFDRHKKLVDIDGDMLVKTKEACGCSVCNMSTNWMSSSFMKHFCSSECLGEAWNWYFEEIQKP